MPYKLSREIPDIIIIETETAHEFRTAGEINRGKRNSIIHRHDSGAIALNASLLTES